MRAVVTREVDRSALEQREDIAKLSVSLRNDLTAKGLQFNDVDQKCLPGGAREDDLLQGLEGQVRRRSLADTREVHRRAGVSVMKVEPVGTADVAEAFAPAERHWAAPVDTVLRHLVEIPAALLVVAEIVVLLAGVIGRYVFHEPIIWSDELASILFLWLAMLGSVVALRRGEHMRMTAFVGMASPQVRAFLDVLAIAAALAFLLLIIEPAYHFAAEEIYITTPGAGDLEHLARCRSADRLRVDDHYVLLRLLQVGNWRLVLGALALLGVIIAALTALQPLLQGLGNLNLLIFSSASLRQPSSLACQ